MDLIEEIRSDNGFNKELLLRAETDPTIAIPIQALRANLDRALQCLSVDLYSKPTHFLLEFIQNADDNSYAPAETPTLEVKLHSDHMRIECNELGFTAADVRALCKIGASTKKAARGYIGEKGIGFKSVFKVADVVHVSSNGFAFKFDRDGELGMITPARAAYPACARARWTQFHLRLARATDGAALGGELRRIHPSLLLFLRRLRALRVEVVAASARSVRVHTVVPKGADVLSLLTVESAPRQFSAEEDYFMVRHAMRADVKDEKRENVAETEVILAFPISGDGAPSIGTQNVHAFLPLRSYNFKFIIQADFLTQSSRDGILVEREWNKNLRTGIIDAFCAAVERFKQHPTLQFAWVAYLPDGITDPFFKPVEVAIVSRLRTAAVLQSRDGAYCMPEDMLVVPRAFLDADGAPLLAERHLAKLFYLSTAYDAQAHGALFNRLGVREMGVGDVVGALVQMGALVCRETDAWRERVCEVLHGNIFGARAQYASPGERTGWNFKVRMLQIIPLCDGTWTNLNSDRILFDSQSVMVPQDLGLRLVDRRILPSSFHYLLLKSLNVKEADPEQVAHKILQLHRELLSGAHKRTAQQLICHARFMFDYRGALKGPFANELLVADSDGRTVFGASVYMDDLEDSTRMRMSEIMPAPARFLHKEYMEQYADERTQKAWYAWLRDNLRVNTAPRLVFGRLSEEFKTLVRTAATPTLLLVLKENWGQIRSMGRGHSEYLAELAGASVTCAGGAVRRMSTTYLPTKQLAPVRGLHFLPIEDPDARGWLFLCELGVSNELNGSFFIKYLVDLQKEGSTDEKEIEWTYNRLQAHFDDGEDAADAIWRHFWQDRLIYVKGKWVGRDQVVWGGPPLMTIKFDISTLYPYLGGLFHHRLDIQPAPDDIMAHELRSLVRGWRGRQIPSDFRKSLLRILTAIAQQIREHPDRSTWAQEILDEPIFPVDYPRSPQPILQTVNDAFFVPDDSGKFAKVFGDEAPLLAFSRAEMVVLEPLLNQFDLSVKSLSRLVAEKTYVSGDGLIIPTESILYASKAKYLNRLVFFTCSEHSPDLFRQLQSMKVVRVSTITSTLSLYHGGVCLEKTQSKESLVQTDCTGRLIIYKNASCSPSQYSVSLALAEYLQVDGSKVNCIVRFSSEEMEEYLLSLGIGDVALDYGLDVANDSTAWLAPTPAATPSPLPHALPISPGDGMAQPHSQNPRSSLTGYQHDGAVTRHGFAPSGHARAGAAGGVVYQTRALPSRGLQPTAAAQPVLPPLDSGEWPPLPNGSAVAGQSGAGDALAATSGAAHRQASENAESKLTGVIGEAFVFRYLRRLLPDFTHEHWTSELRHYDGHAPFAGHSLADFVYPDAAGWLTGAVYGAAARARWRGCWPVFYVEVKTTSGDATRDFHMSEAQLQMARALTWTAERVPRQVYVVFGVSNVFSVTPSLHFFPDPHRMFYDGRLEIASDVQVVVRNESGLVPQVYQ